MTIRKFVAFAIIYLVWGSTFLAIRAGVEEVPPFLCAAMRFLAAGLALYLWSLGRGEQPPNRHQWLSMALLASLIFVGDYGLLFWAERRVASGVAAVILATIPAFTALAEVVLAHTRKLTLRLASALLTGLAGVAVLVNPLGTMAGAPVDAAGAGALIFAAFSWSVASALTPKLALPRSKAVSSGAQMLIGGVLLAMAALTLGEFGEFDVTKISSRAWLALAYLVVAGSIIGFTAYTWLLHHESPTKVATYAYVNPVVALGLGYAFGREPLSARAIAGAVCVLMSVVIIVSAKKPQVTTAAAAGRAPADRSPAVSPKANARFRSASD